MINYGEQHQAQLFANIDTILVVDGKVVIAVAGDVEPIMIKMETALNRRLSWNRVGEVKNELFFQSTNNGTAAHDNYTKHVEVKPALSMDARQYHKLIRQHEQASMKGDKSRMFPLDGPTFHALRKYEQDYICPHPAIRNSPWGTNYCDLCNKPMNQ